jgi:sterol desaturase/sphingolipid hydroxylase (fatty acid hydroxylase superfamily)
MNTIFQKLMSINIDLFGLIVLTFYFVIEQIINRASLAPKRINHFLNGIPLFIGYMLFSFSLAFAVGTIVQWIGEHHLGLFNQFKISYPLKVLLGVLCIDFTSYWFHRGYHTFSLPWRLHRVHHSDTHLDSTSYFRFHPFDWFLDNSSALVAVFVFGLDLNILTFNILLYIPLFIAHHSAFTFPTWFDNTFGKVIVSPNFHKVHHHQNQEFTDTNYGNIFIFWDKFFGTFKTLPVSEIKYGLAEFDTDERQSFWYLLKSPFMNVKRNE